LAFVQCDQHSNAWVHRFCHQDGVELFVVEPEHVEVKGDAHPGQNVFQDVVDVVDVVAANVKKVEVLAARR
jgi:hypothetical protein